MTTEDTAPVSYPEYDQDGKRNPLRLPLTERSEQWEIEIVEEMEDYELSGRPRYAFGN